MRIALIDDDPDYHHHLKDELADVSLDCVVTSWFRADQAIREIPTAQPAGLYIVDWRFIGERNTGLTVIETIFASNPDARILLATHIQAVDLEPALMSLVSGGQISMLEKYTNERGALRALLKPSNNPAKVLVLDDDPDDGWLIGEAISMGSNGLLEPVIADSIREGRRALQSTDFGGFVVDYRLQNAQNGVDFITSLPQQQRTKPVVLITGLERTSFDTRTVRLIANGEFFMLHKNDAKPRSLCRCLGYYPQPPEAAQGEHPGN